MIFVTLDENHCSYMAKLMFHAVKLANFLENGHIGIDFALKNKMTSILLPLRLSFFQFSSV